MCLDNSIKLPCTSHITSIRAIFTCMWKIIRGCLRFALFRCVFDPEKSPSLSTNQLQNKKLWRLGHSRFPALRTFSLFLLRVLIVSWWTLLTMNGFRDCFGFGFTKFNRKEPEARVEPRNLWRQSFFFRWNASTSPTMFSFDWSWSLIHIVCFRCRPRWTFVCYCKRC